MAILIDGFNLIYKFPNLEEKMYRGLLNEARDGLLDILKEYKKLKKQHIRVVFDGKKAPSHNLRSEKIGTIDVYYSLDYSADFLIKEFIKKDPNPKMATVVTSDNDIIFFVNRFKTRVIKSERFAEIVTETIEEQYTEKDTEKNDNPVLSEEDITFWEKIFKKRKV